MGWVHHKPIYRREFPKKGRLAQYADLRVDLAKNGGVFEGKLIPQCRLC